MAQLQLKTITIYKDNHIDLWYDIGDVFGRHGVLAQIKNGEIVEVCEC